jgi:hypothetical protein
MGRRIRDGRAEVVGTVVDTWPYDGGGQVEMAVVRLGRLGGRRMVPVATLRPDGLGSLWTPYLRTQIEDSPELDDGRHGAEADERAISHWGWEEPPSVGTLTRRWQQSSGSSATGRPSPTTPSRTTSAS